MTQPAEQALYRAWRPRTFAEVVGQEHVTRTLRNAIARGQVRHAYLFAGPRGTGKTSLAKILARSVNCLSPKGSDPCNECVVCRSILDGRCLDVIEIDAASNRGIDEIRDLREKIRYLPTEARTKVYIVDEVHMLTAEAWNALLKTLEEPPGHAMFIMATTEVTKVPQTILSRCQRFDFRRLTAEEVRARLAEVVSDKGWSVDEAALWAIARAADGGLRDALSLLDQVAAYAAGEDGGVRVEDVLSLLGSALPDALGDIVGALADGDAAALLLAVAQALGAGSEVRQLGRDLAGYARDLLLVASVPEPGSLLVTAGADVARMREEARRLGPDRLLELSGRLAGLEAELRWAEQPRLLLEAALLGSLACATPAEAVAPAPLSSAASPVPAGPALERPPLPTPERPAPQSPAPAPPTSELRDSAPTSREPNAPTQAADFDAIARRWDDICAEIGRRDQRIRAFLREGRPAELRGKQLVIAFGPEYTFHRDRVQGPGRAAVEAVLEQFGFPGLQIHCVTQGSASAASRPTSPPPARPLRHEKEGQMETARREVEAGARELAGTAPAVPGDVGLSTLDDPIVQSAVQLFEGGVRVVPVENGDGAEDRDRHPPDVR